MDNAAFNSPEHMMKTFSSIPLSTFASNSAEVESLSPVIPFFNPHPPNPLPVVQRVVDVLSCERTGKFLLDDNLTHLHTLTDPSYVQKAVTSLADAYRIASPVFSLHSTLQTQLCSSVIPICEENDVTYGIMVRQDKPAMFKDLHCTERDDSFKGNDILWQGRFILDFNSQFFIMVFNDERFMRVTVFSRSNTIQTTRFQLVFDRSKLMKIIQNPNLQSNTRALMSSLCSYAALDAFRRCPRCNTSPAVPCSCHMRGMIMRKARERGVPKLPIIVSSLIGSSCGIAHYLDFAQGAPLQSRAYGHVMEHNTIGSLERTTSLLKRAATEFMQEAHCNPWKTVLPASDRDGSQDTLLQLSSCEASEEGIDLEELDALVKKRLRLEKNRACARRSNLKKKLENDLRKQQLRDLRSKELKLVMRERELRVENMNLRKQLRDQGIDST